MKSWPGGNTDPRPSAQYSACAFLTSSRSAASATSWSISAVEYVPSGFSGGPYTPYCDGAAENGLTPPHCGVSGCWTAECGPAQVPSAGVIGAPAATPAGGRPARRLPLPGVATGVPGFTGAVVLSGG